MNNYLAAARAMDSLLLELAGKGLTPPPRALEDLKAGRALASMATREPQGAQLEAKIAPLLESVEMNLLSLAETAGGAEFADVWQAKLAAAYRSPAQATSTAGKMRGVPRDVYPIRIQASALEGVTPPEALGLAMIEQEDGYALIYGKKENISVFLDNMRRKQGKVGFKRNG
jgi:hypothetical protein